MYDNVKVLERGTCSECGGGCAKVDHPAVGLEPTWIHDLHPKQAHPVMTVLDRTTH